MSEKSKNVPANRPVDVMQNLINSDAVQSQFRNALGENKDLFIASLISIYSTTPDLQKCYPSAVIKEALKAAVLKLPIVPELGFAYLGTFKNGQLSKKEGREVRDPTMMIGYRGEIQLSLRSNQVIAINFGAVYEGETVITDRISGNISISGEKKNDREIGYFGYFKLRNGFEKSAYRTKKEALEHAKQYSAGFNANIKVWKDNQTEMLSKQVLASILRKFAPKSIDFLLTEDSIQEFFNPSPELHPEDDMIPEDQDNDKAKPEQPQQREPGDDQEENEGPPY